MRSKRTAIAFVVGLGVATALNFVVWPLIGVTSPVVILVAACASGWIVGTSLGKTWAR